MSTSGDHEETFNMMIAALNRTDVDAVAGFFAEDGVVVSYAEPSVRHRGRAEIAALVRGYFELLRDLSFEIVTVVASGDRLAAELVLRGTPTTGAEPVEMQVGAFYEFRDGEVLSEHVYLDAGQLPMDA